MVDFKNFLIDFICKFIPFPNTRSFVKKKLKNFHFFYIKKYFYKYRIYFWYVDNNFGDMLNIDVMKYFKVKFCLQPANKNASFIGIGSILDSFLSTPTNNTDNLLHIWGSGFIMPPVSENEKFCRPIKIHALRGKLTLERCKKILNSDLSNVVLGDPGLLINRIFTNRKKEKLYDVGIICHYVDKKSAYLKNIKLKKLSFCFIDIQQSTSAVVQQVSQCKFILSSAMHGLICADSLGIPNKHILLSDRVVGKEYKFRDYYSVFSCPYQAPIDLRKTEISDSDVERLKKEYKISLKEINNICDNLTRVFPKKIQRKRQ